MTRHERRNSDAGRSSDNRARHRASSSSARRGARDQSRVQRPAQHRRKKAPLYEVIALNAVYIVGAAAVIAILAIVLIAARSCAPVTVYDYDGELDFEYENPYEDKAFFMTAKGRLAYDEGSGAPARTGIDVSENQGDIDWQAVAEDGIDFAMIRLGYRGATEGQLFVDEMFAQNLEEAQAADVDCGVYFFSQAISKKEAIEEADFILKKLDGAMLEYPIALDFEEAVPGVLFPRGAGQDKDKMSAIADAFCARIEQAGYHAMVYGNYYDLDLYHYSCLETKEIWWAEYDVERPNPNLDITMWQYASEGWVDGVSTPVDMNLDMTILAN